MSLGILGSFGLTDLESEYQQTMPAPGPQCWAQPGFTTCHDQNYRACQAYGLSVGRYLDNCVYGKDAQFCGCRVTQAPAANAGAGLVMGNKTSNPVVVQLQKDINAVLTKNGYAALSTDGKLGPGTCGAAREADKFGAGLMAKYGLAGVCTSFTTPAKLSSGGGGGGFTPPSGGGLAPTQASTLTSSAGLFGMDTQTLLLIAAVAAGAYVFFGPKKKAAS